MHDLNKLLERLASAQRDLILQAAEVDMLPSDGAIKRIAELENAIAAVEALIHDEHSSARKAAA
jgi:hypothetical protein